MEQRRAEVAQDALPLMLHFFREEDWTLADAVAAEFRAGTARA